MESSLIEVEIIVTNNHIEVVTWETGSNNAEDSDWFERCIQDQDNDLADVLFDGKEFVEDGRYNVSGCMVQDMTRDQDENKDVDEYFRIE